MLRKTKPQNIKYLGNSAMYVVEEKQIKVKCISPIDGSEIGERTEFVQVRKEVDPLQEVAHDTADMYNIDTMQSLGVTPRVLAGAYISDRLTAFESAEKASSKILDEIEKQEYAASFKAVVSQSNVESTKE